MYEDIKTACLYVRFSSHNQTEQSIEGQTRVCRDFCKRHNIRIVEIYADRATSASKDIEKRVQFLKMIKDSEKGLFDAVIVYKLDRFARSRYDSATYKYRLKRNGVQLISATENISNDPEGIILESVLEGMAEFYSAELSQKINRGMRESAYKHNSIGGAIPLGYKIEDKKLVIDPKTAPIVKEAFEKYADGETVAEICRQFNARGYKTSKGTAFGKSSFTKIFRNERYIGVYTFHDYRAEDAIPAIIDKDLWDRVQLRVGKIKNAPARNKAKVVYLLSGKIFCGHCGSKMNGNCNAGNYCYYQCYGKKNGNVDCKKKNIRKEFIEKLVAQDALSLLTDEYIEQIATIACEKNQHEIELDSALPTIRDRIHQVDLSLNHLLKAIESGSAPDMLVKRMGELEKEKKDLQAQAKKESEDIVELDKAQVIYWLEQFRGGSIEDEEFCRMLIDLFVNSVTVWDEDDNTYKVTVAYNLTSLPTKTYRLNKGGTLSDFASNAPTLIDETRENVHGEEEPYLIFNNVGAWPVQRTADRKQDAVYIEVWPPYDRYASIAQLIRDARTYAKDDKSTILAAYLKPFREGKREKALPAAKLLMGSIVSNGATHLLTGENQTALTQGYYSDYTKFSDSEAEAIRRYYDYMIRYENLFFDPELQDVTMTHTGWDNYEYQCTSHKVSSYGEAGKIWMILREKDYRKCIYLLNLCGQSEDYWNEGKEEPNIQKDIKFTVQVDTPVEKICFSTPDEENMDAIELSFTERATKTGKFIDFTVPSLNYWTTIWIDTRKETI